MLAQSLLIAAISAPVLIAALVTVVIGAGAGLAWMLLNQSGDKAAKRLEKLSSGAPGGGSEPSSLATGGGRLADMLDQAAPKLADQLMPKKEAEISALKAKLNHAGFRGENASAKYMMIRLIFLGIGIFLASTAGITLADGMSDFLIYGGMIAGITYYIPGVYLWFRIKKRKDGIFFGLPDALDLMVVCVEAGLGLDAAMRKVSEEMDSTCPIIAEEFNICNFQLQVGRPRREVLHEIGQRTGVDDMKSLAAILIQADRFGSSIAQALRTQSDAMRVRRRQMAEERAQKTAVHLIFPLVLFIFPSIFIVLVGPAAILILHAFS